MFIVEHNRALITQVAQRGCAMDKGRVVAELGQHEIGERELLLR